jgi:hypothetical protein
MVMKISVLPTASVSIVATEEYHLALYITCTQLFQTVYADGKYLSTIYLPGATFAGPLSMKEMFIRSVLVAAALPEPNTELGLCYHT